MTPKYTVTLLQEAVEDLRRLEDFSIERELASQTPDWTTPQRALDAIRPPASVPVVLFPLVPNRAHDHVVADDLEENDVARATERNDQFAGAAITKFGPTARERRPGQ